MQCFIYIYISISSTGMYVEKETGKRNVVYIVNEKEKVFDVDAMLGHVCLLRPSGPLY